MAAAVLPGSGTAESTVDGEADVGDGSDSHARHSVAVALLLSPAAAEGTAGGEADGGGDGSDSHARHAVAAAAAALLLSLLLLKARPAAKLMAVAMAATTKHAHPTCPSDHSG